MCEWRPDRSRSRSAGRTHHHRRKDITRERKLIRAHVHPQARRGQRTWHVIDATDVVLGRLASQTAILLRGKHKPTFAPHVDTGDFVIIINADKVALTGAKLEQKKAYRHSGYPGGLTATSYTELLEKNPEQGRREGRPRHAPEELARPRQQLTKLKVYAGAEHPHAAQQPVPFEITQVAQ